MRKGAKDAWMGSHHKTGSEVLMRWISSPGLSFLYNHSLYSTNLTVECSSFGHHASSFQNQHTSSCKNACAYPPNTMTEPFSNTWKSGRIYVPRSSTAPFTAPDDLCNSIPTQDRPLDALLHCIQLTSKVNSSLGTHVLWMIFPTVANKQWNYYFFLQLESLFLLPPPSPSLAQTSMLQTNCSAIPGTVIRSGNVHSNSLMWL